MLLNIEIKNILLIESIEIDLSQGLCIFTGETGAGKSMILDSILFVIGKKFSTKLIRNDQEYASVTASFNIEDNSALKEYIEEYEIKIDSEIVIKRIIYRNGRNKIFINDQLISLNILENIGQMLIEIHGQHQHSDLLEERYQRSILDQFASYNELLIEVKNNYKSMRKTQQDLEELKNQIDENNKQKDYLSYLINEISELNISKKEEENLTIKRQNYQKKDKMIHLLKSALSEICDNNVEKHLNSAGRILSRNNSEDYEIIIESIEKAIIEIAESVNLLSIKISSLMNSDESIDEIEKRLFLIKSISRKYQKHSDDLQEYKEESLLKLNELIKIDQNITHLELKLNIDRDNYLKSANKLSQKRSEYANILENEVHNELSYLEMKKVKFKIIIEKIDEKYWSDSGINKISFQASTNPGQAIAPIRNIASGGELSRFMLALKVVLSKNKSDVTLIFDEIDTGIGGAVANLVGNRLKFLSKNNQILLITHQPQIAAKSDLHLFVKKEQLFDDTKTSLKILSDQDREDELARMLAGDLITKEVREVAKQLMSN